MKEKTSITLSKEVLAEVDRIAGSKHSRSAMIERVLRKYLRERRRAALHARDLQLINQAADALSAEAMDVLEYQAPIDWSSDTPSGESS
ncbi:MAG: ribbon-helix-helix protein, CopG family [Candidatus Korobacteraceae bacterium]